MSVLTLPRIHFNGGFHTSPTTSNNDYESIAIDEANVVLKEPLLSMTDAQARQWLMSTFTAPSNGQVWIRCGWNYYGDYDTNLDNATVTAVTCTDGSIPASDPLLSAAVTLVGEAGSPPVIVDCDPTGIVTTQIFTGGFSVGSGALGIQARSTTRCYSRWRNNLRNVSTAPGNAAAAIFQFAVPKAGITVSGAAQSGVLNQLQQALAEALGLIFQFTVYQVLPTMTEAALAAQFQQGNFVSNPAVGLAVGTIGLWENGDLETEVNGRRLNPPSTFNLTYNGNPYTLGTAAFQAQPSGKVISLNFANTIPETGYTAPLQKVNLGTLRLMAQPPGGGDPQLAGEIAPGQYDYAAYSVRGGIVDVALRPGIDIANSQFSLLEDASQGDTVLLAEPDFVVESDSRAIYFDQPDPATVNVFVTQRGAPPTADVTLKLWEYQFQPEPPVDGLTTWDLLPAKVHRIGYPSEITVTAGQPQPIAITVQSVNPGSLSLVYTVNNDPPPDNNSPVFPWMYAYFTNMRVLPEDNFDSITAPTYQDIYQHILRYYYLIYPAMSQVIPFNSEDAVRAAATAMLDRLDPANWESCLFMPVTREMSRGKRTLFARWTDSVKAKGGLTP